MKKLLVIGAMVFALLVMSDAQVSAPDPDSRTVINVDVG